MVYQQVVGFHSIAALASFCFLLIKPLQQRDYEWEKTVPQTAAEDNYFYPPLRFFNI